MKWIFPRKYLAFLYLQTLAELDHCSLPEKVDVTELTGSVELGGEKLALGIKVKTDFFDKKYFN